MSEVKREQTCAGAPLPRTHARTHTRTHTRTRARTHTHTHTHTTRTLELILNPKPASGLASAPKLGAQCLPAPHWHCARCIQAEAHSCCCRRCCSTGFRIEFELAYYWVERAGGARKRRPHRTTCAQHSRTLALALVLSSCSPAPTHHHSHVTTCACAHSKYPPTHTHFYIGRI